MFKKGELHFEYSSEGFWSFKNHGNVKQSDLSIADKHQNYAPRMYLYFPNYITFTGPN